MVNRVRSVDFLPPIFQTPTNRQFLGATFDQLVQEPGFKKTEGFIGRQVGPGVNPRDSYILETTKTRADYQLEPGVVSLKPTDTTKITNTITYPGINDALNLQGAYVDDPDRLYSSEYYAFDPFVDLDKFINYSQYFWIPVGPQAVAVNARQYNFTEDFTVTRNPDTNAYTFSDTTGAIFGNNPTITLLRTGNYNFTVEQNLTQTETVPVNVVGSNGYTINNAVNPTVQLVRGNTYIFDFTYGFGVNSFYIKTVISAGTIDLWTDGITNNGGTGPTGQLIFKVPQDAPNTLFYCDLLASSNFQGQFDIIDAVSGTGPLFSIQTQPGVEGEISWSPNISSRVPTIGGVTNNTTDLGVINFIPPTTIAQNYFYNLTNIGGCDLISNNVPLAYFQGSPTVANFISTYGNIDGINNLDGRTIFFPSENDNTIYLITYVAGNITITVSTVVSNDTKFTILFGAQYINTTWYRGTTGNVIQMPLLTALDSELYYQDSEDPLMFGKINLIDATSTAILDINEILGSKQYTSPNGVAFTSGLIVFFDGLTVPASYQNSYFVVEGVGESITLTPLANLVVPETYANNLSIPYDSTNYDMYPYDGDLNAPIDLDYIVMNRASPDNNAWSRCNRWFHVDTITAAAQYNNQVPDFSNFERARRPILEYRSGIKLFNSGTLGASPITVIDLTTTNALLTVNGQPEFVIDQFSLLEGSTVIFAADTDPRVRNKIWQVSFVTPDSTPATNAGDFVVGRTYRIVTLGNTNFTAVGATSNTVGTEFTATGVGTGTGTAEFIQPVINLTAIYTMLINDMVVTLTGATTKGTSWYWDGIEYLRAQQKTSINQAPFFDVFDVDNVSFGDQIKYPSTSFRGNKLFSYAVGTGQDDPVLGFPLRYRTISNIFDIIFDNNLYTDTFTFTKDRVGSTLNVSTGFVHEYTNRTDYARLLGWQTAITRSLVRQQFRFTYDGTSLQFDIFISPNFRVPSIQLYRNSKFLDPSNYTVSQNDKGSIITIDSGVAEIDDIIEAAVLSSQISTQGFYQVPINLSNNPLNANSAEFTLGTVRTHYQTICENLIDLQGPVDGANNTRDLGNILPYGLTILQQSSPVTLAGYFMREEQYDIFNALDYNGREYIKFKDKLLDNVVTNDYTNLTIPEVVDAAIADINRGKTDTYPFYWSDMLPASGSYTTTTIEVTPITGDTFTTVQTYNFSSANFLGLLVYLNGEQLNIGQQYTVATDGPRLTILVPLTVGDILTINEYNNTAGNFVPNTPSKMGLYPAYAPELYYDTTYAEPTFVVLGHDGSKTIAFPDYRTQVLLEFEKRIYNNIKMQGNPVPLFTESVVPGFFSPISYVDSVGVLPPGLVNVLPGYFRGIDYSSPEVTAILSKSFLSWVGWNKLDYKTQDYIAQNAFSWNYSQSGNKITNEPLQGAWRGIYRYFYDTDTPNLTPWEMLGFTVEPSWWSLRYGPAPYTAGNLVLWDDLENGIVADPAGPYILPEYVRPGLDKVIPVDEQGELLSPFESVVGNYDENSFRRSWQVGDGGPVEASWIYSSSYPFAYMRLLILSRPAEFFALFADRDLYKYSQEFGQYLYNGRYRLDANGVEVYGNGVSKASYINWIVDYNKQIGLNSTKDLTEALQNLDVRLCYRLGGYSSKDYLSFFCERSSPNSSNTSLLIPDVSYNLSLYKNVPFSNIEYSACIVEVVEGGYQIFGYSNSLPYFTIQVSNPNGFQQTIEAGGKVVQVPATYTQQVAQIPYGTTFTNDAAVVDFLLGYGKYLEDNGIIYETQENGYTMNWRQMAAEFVYFAQQGWSPGTMINLNPSAITLAAVKVGAVVDTIDSISPENMVLDQNRAVLPTKDLIIERYGNEFTINSPTNQTISYANLKFTSYEQIVVFDNADTFGDLIYDPVTGARQNRLKVVGSITSEWDGTFDTRGFILNENNIQEWQPNRKYTKGEIVLYKNTYWSAQTIVQPKELFDFNDWVKSDYTRIQQGLLPNIATKADELADVYDVRTVNLQSDANLFAYGLIGFRPREYMAALNLDDSTQVQVYQQFLKSKGTRLSTDIFTRAQFGRLSGEYTIYENWATLAGVYGAQANKSFIELRLNEALLRSDPSTIQILQPPNSGIANQTIFLQDVWRESYKLTSPNVFKTFYPQVNDSTLPTAGYVNFDDADITVFNINDPKSIEANIEIVGTGTTIWIAKTNSYDWGIFRCEVEGARITQISDNLNRTSLATFDQPHDLAVGDLIIIRYFNEAVNGVYRVLSVPAINSITIAYTFTPSDQTTIFGTGLVFYLQSMRVSQASNIADLPYADSFLPGAKVYVDNDGFGHWVVLEKTDSFTTSEVIYSTGIDPSVNVRYGTSVSQSYDQVSALVGVPGLDTDQGIVVAYRRNNNNNYVFTAPLKLDTTGTRGFGQSSCYGDSNWSVIGAPRSLNNLGYAAILFQSTGIGDYRFTQLLLPPDYLINPVQSFGEYVWMTDDDRWCYVGAPAANKVYAYGLQNVQVQTVSYTGDGTTDTFKYSDNIIIDNAKPTQLFVNVNGAEQIAGVDYTIVSVGSGFGVEFVTVPPDNAIIGISRREYRLYGSESYNNVPSTAVTGSGTGATFIITNLRGQYSVSIDNIGTNYAIGDTLTILGTAVGGTTPANNITVTVTSVSFTGITEFTFAGTGNFNTIVNVGDYFYTATSIETFNLKINNVLQRPEIDYTYNVGTGLIVFAVIPAIGAEIVVNAGSYWKYAGEITPAGIPVDAEFGASVSASSAGDQVGIGAPRDDGAQLNSGAVYVYGKSSYTYIVSDPTQLAYAIPGNVINGPVAVTLNNNYLQNSYQSINGQFTVPVGNTQIELTTTAYGNANIVSATGTSVTYSFNGPATPSFIAGQTVTVTDISPVNYNGTFVISSVSGNTITVSSTVMAGNVITLGNIVQYQAQVGDEITIENNQFQLIQRILSHSAIDEEDFGRAVEICSNDCSIVIGAPNDSTQLTQSGSVDRNVSQPAIYGTITTTIANPVLSAGDTIKINNILVSVPVANTTVAGLISAINASGIPNVIATPTPDATFIGNNSTQIFGIGPIYTAAASYTTVVYVNNVLLTENIDYTYNATTEEIIFVTPPANRAVIVVVSGRMTLSVKNVEASKLYSMLSVLPGVTSTVFNALGVTPYAWTQTIYPPEPTYFGKFGSSLALSLDAELLLVGSPNGNIYQATTFDNGQTFFDDRATTFFNPIFNSGVVYSYDYLLSASDTVETPGKFIFGQQIYNTVEQPNDQFGSALSYVDGKLLVGAPNGNNGANGYVATFNNPRDIPAWQVVYAQQPVVDTKLINNAYLFNRLLSQEQDYLDFFDPLQGKILSVAQRNIDYVGAVDPATYNVGPVRNNGTMWANERVGEIWWDTDSVRFIDPNQDNIIYQSRRWGQVFPGSRIDIYQWTSSPVPPSEYTGEGTPLSIESYTVKSFLTADNIFDTAYFFWVRGITSVATGAGKNLSTTAIASYIESPRSSGIPYLAFLNASTVAIYNSGSLLSAFDTILHINYDRNFNDDNIHLQYDLVPEGKPDGFLTPKLYLKLIDSFSGIDSNGNNVPDPTLSPAERYGVQFRPRQSMFSNRFAALENYLGYVNNVLLKFPIRETRSFNLLNSSQPIPSVASGQWNLQVPTIEVLSYQDIYAVPLGYKYLVTSDSTFQGKWTIYEVKLISSTSAIRELSLTTIENFNTKLFWSYVDWYEPGYNSSVQIVIEVPNKTALDGLTLSQYPIGTSAKVTANGQGLFEIYLRTDLGWRRVGLESGTIQFSETLWNYALGKFGYDADVFDNQGFDQEPVIETRKIIEAINQELLIDELLIDRNSALVLMFSFVYSEFLAPDWLFKTSLIDVNHKISTLDQTQIYQQNNQEFVLDYIQEVKPYHVQIREFNLGYSTTDLNALSVTDFDVPAYYDNSLDVPQYVSPVLLPYEHANTTVRSTVSDRDFNAQIWKEEPWNQWFNNFGLEIDSITIVNGGAGYTEIPDIVVATSSGVLEDAIIVPTLNNLGTITSVAIINPGQYYGEISLIVSGANAVPANLQPTLSPGPVRDFIINIKYDRYQYESNIVSWTANVTYPFGTQVRFANTVFSANVEPSVTSSDFNPFQWTLVQANALSGVDRTMGYYVAGNNMPGLSLPLLITGVEYPGVQVYGDGYVYGNVTLDAIYESNYLDTYLGTRPFDVNVNGGAYIGTYSSHAPEELVPGAEFDTMDLKVYTSGGFDQENDGHGFPLFSKSYTVEDWTVNTLDFAGLVANPTTIVVTNQSAGVVYVENIQYAVNWATQTVSLLTPVSSGTVINITVYELGGGNQLFVTTATTGNVDTVTIKLPISNSIVTEYVPFVNGQYSNSFVVSNTTSQTTDLTFTFGNTANRLITTVALGAGNAVPNYSWSNPVPQIITVTDPSVSSYTLTNNIDYLNPVTCVVNRNGERLRTAAGVEYANIQSSTQLVYALPRRLSDEPSDFAVSAYTVTGTGPFLVEFDVGLVQDISSAGSEVDVRSDSNPLLETGTTPLPVVSNTSTTITVEYPIDPGNTTVGNTTVTTVSYSNTTQVYIDNILQSANSGNYQYSTPYYSPTGKTPITTQGNITVNGANVTFDLSAPVSYPALVPSAWEVFDLEGNNSSLNGTYLCVAANATSITLEYPSAPGNIVDPGNTILSSTRVIQFANTTPDLGSDLYVATNLNVDAFVANGNIVINTAQIGNLVTGDVLEVITWNDTREQNLLNQVWVGPTQSVFTVSQGYDTTPYDTGTVDFAPGSFDYGFTLDVPRNNFILQRPVPNLSRLWVTLNGERLFPGTGFTVRGTELVLAVGTVNSGDVVMALEVSNDVVITPYVYRIFQDMRGLQLNYKITTQTTTELTEPLLAPDDQNYDDTIYVANIDALSEPDLDNNTWGVLSINGERIMYRVRDVLTSSVSSLLRGTSGTAAAAHEVDAVVTNFGLINLLPAQYQNYVNVYSEIANGTDTVFTAPDITAPFGSAPTVSSVAATVFELSQAVQVTVGGATPAQRFNGDGSANQFTLDITVPNNEAILAFNNGVILPYNAYTANGTLLVINDTPQEGDVIEVRYYKIVTPTIPPAPVPAVFAVEIEFVVPPPEGLEVTSSIKQAKTIDFSELA